jgi:hypothetical protein
MSDRACKTHVGSRGVAVSSQAAVAHLASITRLSCRYNSSPSLEPDTQRQQGAAGASSSGRMSLASYARSVRKSYERRAPVAVKELVAAAGQGNLGRVAGIQARVAWSRFGTLVVALGCAAGTYYAWRAGQTVYHFVTGVRNDKYTLTITVRSPPLPSSPHTRRCACECLLSITCTPPQTCWAAPQAT